MMEEWHNILWGRRCFILGTGPSLLTHKTETLARLGGEITFACSGLVNWGAIPFQPTYQVITEDQHCRNPGPLWWKWLKGHFLVFHENMHALAWTWVPKARPGQYLVHIGTKGMGDTFEPLAHARTTPLVAAQLALWMGCSELYLLGCDLALVGRVYDLPAVRNVSKQMVLAEPYRVAAEEMARHGRSLYDCTPGGYLSSEGYVPYKELADVLG